MSFKIESHVELSKLKIEDLVMYNNKMYYVEKIHKTNTHIGIILNDTTGNCKEILINN
jgi:hypothetical protein